MEGIEEDLILSDSDSEAESEDQVNASPSSSQAGKNQRSGSCSEKLNQSMQSMQSVSATSSQFARKRFEKNISELGKSGKRRKSTANAYVWIKERRTTFTGLTFEQREKGLNMSRRSMTMIEKKPPRP